MRGAIRLWLLVMLLICGMWTGAEAQAQNAPWAGKIVSLQGSVSLKPAGQSAWQSVTPNQLFHAGDILRVPPNGRAAILLPNQTVLRLDQKSTLQFTAPEKQKSFLLRLIEGAAHFFSRTPRKLKIETPFVNASVEGTEFLVRVGVKLAEVILFEGTVLAENSFGSQLLEAGQSIIARAGEAPVLTTMVRPRDAVVWTLYYPPVVDNDVQGPHGENLKAAQKLLSVGSVDEALAQIEAILTDTPDQGAALALKAIILVVQNKVEEAFGIARRATMRAPDSAAAHLAESYVRQALFNLEGALESVQTAVKSEPRNALAQARLSELYLSLDRRDAAISAAERAVALAPDLAHTQSVLGFAHLSRVNLKQARYHFKRAIALDQAAPLPRLGLGLVKIRQGDLPGGRGQIEIAAVLDAGNALIRSYLGKAYAEERRDKPAAAQLEMAKALDPKDPTPWYYDALRKQTQNRPVEALYDLHEAMERNDNRAVYRSRLLLDQDLAAHGASQATIYRQLGFEQQALTAGWRALNKDPGSFSAHRFMADLYSALPRHEIARVSELHQSQMMQPITINPISPQLAQSGLRIQDGAGPSQPGFKEYTPLFLRDRLRFQLNGVVGGNATWGEDISLSGISGNASFGIGRFHYRTDGFRENNDQEHLIHNFLTQFKITPDTTLLTELRHLESQRGDLELIFGGDFSETMRQTENVSSLRLGVRHTFSPGSDLLASFVHQNIDLSNRPIPIIETTNDIRVSLVELQYQHRRRSFDIVTGVFHRKTDGDRTIRIFGMPSTEYEKNQFSRLYLYGYGKQVRNMNWTVGFSADRLDEMVEDLDQDQINPKLGLTWSPLPTTTVRGAVFRTLTRPWSTRQNVDPSLEPTQVAGFNQEFLEPEGSDSWRYGVAVDYKVNSHMVTGVEVSGRQIKVPRLGATSEAVAYFDRQERMGRAYFNWTPCRYAALSVEYNYEWFDRPDEKTVIGIEQFSRLETHRFPLALRVFHPRGLSAEIKATYVDQSGDFVIPILSVGTAAGEDQFWVVDAAVNYRLPGGKGLISLEAKNIFDKQFNFQDTDPANPRIAPGSLFLLRATFWF